MVVKNPCIDPAFVSIEKKPLPSDVSYTLLEGNRAFIHSPFELVTTTDSQALCGSITYTATFDGVPVSLETVPMSYDSESLKFMVFSDQSDHIGTHTITLSASLVNYP